MISIFPETYFSALPIKFNPSSVGLRKIILLLYTSVETQLDETPREEGVDSLSCYCTPSCEFNLGILMVSFFEEVPEETVGYFLI